VKSYVLDPAACDDLDEAMEWYEERQRGLGLELQDAVELAIATKCDNPSIGPRYGTKGMQFYRVHRFPFVIYYESQPNLIWIAAIAHKSRRPNYWRKRKPPGK
jgi:plasmid stabilization system protein ParE